MYNNERCMDMAGAMPKAEMPKDMKYPEAKEMMMGANPCCQPMPGCVCPPVYECPQERCCHREIIHEVPHIQPINTRVINHHIYRHTFEPCFTCCEENVCLNVFEGPRCR